MIDENSYLLQVSRYIHRNPIELKKPLTDELSAYIWSSYPAYLQKAPSPAWLNQEMIYGELGRYSPEAYKAFVDQGLDEDTLNFYKKSYTSSIWGDNDFKTCVHAKAEPRKTRNFSNIGFTFTASGVWGILQLK